jgi:hypothetical protein
MHNERPDPSPAISKSKFQINFTLFPIILLLVGFSCVASAQDKKTDKKISEKESVRYDFCGSRSWQKGRCGDRQIGKGYTVCETYLKYLNQSLPKLNVCDIPIPPNFKSPDWEIMDIKSNLRLAYNAEALKFAWLATEGSWYKQPDFESWKKELLQEVAEGKIIPIMKKARITPTTKGAVTILAYARDSTGCDKKMRGVFPDDKSILNYWMDSGYTYSILTKGGNLLEVNGALSSVTDFTHELFMYAGKPYFARASSDGVYPRGRSVEGIWERLTLHNPDPDYLYTKQFCQFKTVNKP